MGNIGDIINPVISVENFRGLKFKTLLVDGYDFLYNALIRIRVPTLMMFDNLGNPTHQILYILEYITFLLKKKIKPVFIFDGINSETYNLSKTNNKKKDIVSAYLKVKNEFDSENIPNEYSIDNLYKTIIEDVSYFIEICGSQAIIAPDDALPQAAKLINDKKASGLISDKYNCFLFQVPILYRNLQFENNTVQKIVLNDILTFNDINFDQFLDICLLTGNDYYSMHKKGFGAKTSLKAIRKYESIENMIEKDIINYTNIDISSIRKNFLNPIISDVDLNSPNLDIQKIRTYLHNKGFFTEDFNEEIAGLFRAFKNFDLKQGKIEQFFT